ncbi:hypothetical protein UC35_11655 [Ramlibacter tataouinensis]|uniref:Uncharacterized protein n=1 Tax=Ramlibacter tataouinensis TaxID=94132 RepID=A0A127JTW6_9BURK|nr:hypothetical protein UC35_11655 [Ramlibacter tataouinensis]
MGDAMTRRFPQQKIPEPEPGSPEAAELEQATDISRRPGLPEHAHPIDFDEQGEPELPDDRSDLGAKRPSTQRG